MTYFLDFDRTLFDTDAFKVHLAGRADTAPYKDLPELELAALLNKKVIAGELLFEPGELTQFIYADVPDFLRTVGREATIVTFGNPDLQRIKVESAFPNEPSLEVFYTGEVRKGPHLASRPAVFQEACLVDDAPIELELFQTSFPQARVFEMRRDDKGGDGRWPVVHSLSELL